MHRPFLQGVSKTKTLKFLVKEIGNLVLFWDDIVLLFRWRIRLHFWVTDYQQFSLHLSLLSWACSGAAMGFFFLLLSSELTVQSSYKTCQNLLSRLKRDLCPIWPSCEWCIDLRTDECRSVTHMTLSWTSCGWWISVKAYQQWSDIGWILQLCRTYENGLLTVMPPFMADQKLSEGERSHGFRRTATTFTIPGPSCIIHVIHLSAATFQANPC